MPTPPSTPTPREILARAEAGVRARRAAAVDDLALVLAWADLHSTDPAVDVPGGDRLVQLGGDGTPGVRDLCLEELAVAREVHVRSMRSTMADALDLRHRLPLLWLQVRALQVEVWVACKVARRCRHLDRDQVGLVDRAVADATAHSPGRILELADAKIIEADQAARAEELAFGRESTGVWVGGAPRPGDPTPDDGIRTLVARVPTADAIWLDATVDRVADALATDPELAARLAPELPERPTKDHHRAAALGLLGRPDQLAEVLGLLDDTASADRPGRPARPATLYLHLHEAALDGSAPDAVARAEDIGPLLLDQVRDLLKHAQVRLAPVIDLTAGTATHAYEHPAAVKERTLLRTVGDVFPHATNTGRRLDHDHATPFEPDLAGLAPPQTGDHNDAPLSRHSHRAKTHLAYRVRHLGPGTYLWRTPHGLARLVTPTGTHRLDPAFVRALELTLAA